MVPLKGDKPMKKNILFDLDGTLTDPFEGITTSIIYALEKMNANAPDAKSLGWCIGPAVKRTAFPGCWTVT